MRWKVIVVPLTVGVVLTSLAAAGRAQRGGVRAAPQKSPAPVLAGDLPFTLKMQPAWASRPGELKITMDKQGRPQITPPQPVPLTRRGEIRVEGETFSVYLPQATVYSVRNKGRDLPFENRATLLSVDNNGDGKLTKDEGWYANLPVRIGDRMFDVKRIGAGGSAIDLAPSKSPLAGAVVGRKCPPFSYQAQDGGKVTNEDFKGRAFLIDVWSTT